MSGTELDDTGVYSPLGELAPLLTSEEMQRWDRWAIGECGVPERLLMENAGRAAARILQRLHPEGAVVAAVGSGNNGGDAWVMLRALRQWGREVVAVPVSPSAAPAELLHGVEIPTVSADEAEPLVRSAGVLVDGLLGTGASGAPREAHARLIRLLNGPNRPILALDGPSGVDMSTGKVAGKAIRASVTVAFGAAKRGLVLFPGRAHAGRILVAEIGFPSLPDGWAAAAVITPAWADGRRPARPPDLHKGAAGRVVAVAGRPGMAGAAIMLAMGALRAGAGGVRVVSAEAALTPVQAAVPEASFVERSSAEVDEVLRSGDVLVVGSGIGTDEPALEILRRTLAVPDTPLVIDADGVNLLAKHPDLLERASPERILLTPHPREMGRLMELDHREVLADPFGISERAADRFGCTVLLKGSPSLIAVRGRRTLVNLAGHSGIATGGMGDTLAGVIAAFAAGGCGLRDAAALGLAYAGRAADMCGRGHPILPRDVAEAIPAALRARAAPRLPDPDIVLDVPAPL